MSEALTNLEAAAEAVTHAPLDAVTSIDEAVVVLERIQKVRSLLSEAEDECHSFLADTIPGKRYAVEGADHAEVEIVTETRRTQWRHADLMDDLYAAIFDLTEVDPETGELLYRDERPQDKLRRWLDKCVRPSWKVTGLKELGIDPDDYCITEYGKKRARLNVRKDK